MNPLLSVLMTSYNREQYIGEAIESVLDSTYTHWELIIVDDGSKDQTVAIAQSFAANDSRIKVHINEQNLGDYKNRNQAASYAKGEFIMYVDSDDTILKDGFERCINAMQQFPEANFGMQLHGAERAPYFVEAKQAIEQHFFQQPFLLIGPGGTILRRRFFEAIGKYPVLYGPANDMYFNLKATAAGGVLLLPFTFNFYRIHEGQELNNKYSYLYNNFNYLRDALQELNLPLTEKQKVWIQNKNRRRFLVNLLRYLFTSKNLSKTIRARQLAGFSLRDAWKALVHPSI
ncbi:MAG: glycosyltransferase family 2 protein [Chitinophagaceae bacterium]|nr:glycosyltransferase family 2 protein [Chitinophagaceae bacterium]